jgi:hypothetical protein
LCFLAYSAFLQQAADRTDSLLPWVREVEVAHSGLSRLIRLFKEKSEEVQLNSNELAVPKAAHIMSWLITIREYGLCDHLPLLELLRALERYNFNNPRRSELG